MSQLLRAEINIPIPTDLVMVSKVELEKLEKQELTGVYWNMKDLEQRIRRKSEWIKENILFPSRFRKILDSENGGFVYYPQSKGQTWSFQAVEMASFLDKNFGEIFGRR
ncbi:DUF771 domain-containing protein [Aureibacillus halotolerans]|uniref:Phage pi2 protein 07 n=1 Tax=Aureibacillus halotolerans TaxID=1508390 RepID=A0A4R6U810_9BACI|nr:DUF771 domain-containing protein [Aureibacillus halotolerans]TDQ39194.1 phage pi2 protein 07 [Aureibacillus halotolerans]